MDASLDWRPTASRDTLAQRAQALAQTRDFFAARAVLEVETPALVQRAVTDPQLASFDVGTHAGPLGHLHTSPEYAMKRLLAAGSGDIYQLCRVFRAEESSRLHNAEFTLLEWYRLGFSLDALMAETAQYASLICDAPQAPRPVETVSYSRAFQRTLDIEPLTAERATLDDCAAQRGLYGSSLRDCSRDDVLDFLVATVVGPTLGHGSFTCLHHYPAAQAALACLDPADPRTALRFELYADGIELANGYVELADADEQSRRFAADALLRATRGLPERKGDERLLAALQHGLPACAGVALGFDRLLMVALGRQRIDEVIAFPVGKA